MLFAILFIIMAGLFFIFIYIRYNHLFTIKAVTIRMKQPVLTPEGSYHRESYTGARVEEELIALESRSRKSAYRNSVIRTGGSFFDDSDMQGDYYLVVVYDKRTHTPLLSARYYFDHMIISAYLAGDQEQLGASGHSICLPKLKKDEIFLSDRLSGNTGSAIYRKHRNYIFLLFYIQVLKRNHGKKFILMARREKQEKLLSKYLRLGLNISGMTTLRGREHWILLGDVNKILSGLRSSRLHNFFILLRTR